MAEVAVQGGGINGGMIIGSSEGRGDDGLGLAKEDGSVLAVSIQIQLDLFSLLFISRLTYAFNCHYHILYHNRWHPWERWERVLRGGGGKGIMEKVVLTMYLVWLEVWMWW